MCHKTLTKKVKDYCYSSKLLGIIPSALITIGITVILMFHSFTLGLKNSVFKFEFLSPLIFNMTSKFA